MEVELRKGARGFAYLPAQHLLNSHFMDATDPGPLARLSPVEPFGQRPQQKAILRIDQIELSRVENRRSDRGENSDQKADSIDADANRRNDGAPGGFQGAAEAEQHRGPVREVHSMPEQDNQTIEQQATMPSEQRTRHPDDRSLERKPALDAELARSDPPQQHVPRLRQIELELEERQVRDRDDRER